MTSSTQILSNNVIIFPCDERLFPIDEEYKMNVHGQIHDFVQYAGGGYSHEDLYSMPIGLRNFYLNRLIENRQKENKKSKPQSRGVNDLQNRYK